MTEIEELESRVRGLSNEDFLRFRDWFHQLEDERWDQQIEADSKSGRFDNLIERARQETARGEAREL